MSIPITTIHVSVRLCEELVERVKKGIMNQRIPPGMNVPMMCIFGVTVDVHSPLTGRIGKLGSGGQPGNYEK